MYLKYWDVENCEPVEIDHIKLAGGAEKVMRSPSIGRHKLTCLQHS